MGILPTFAKLNPQKPKIMRYAIGIDMGGTNTAFGLVDRQGRILAQGNVPTTGHPTPEAWADALCEAIDTERTALGPDAQAVGCGIGAPCANTATGCIENAADLPWPTFPICGLLSDRLGVKVTVTNDANAAAAGEMAYGAARGMKNFVMLTLGTGVGGGVVCDGHLLSGARGFAGELGHVVVGGDRPCGCGRKGCLETYCSARGVVATAREMLASTSEPSALRGRGELTSKDIYDAAVAGDALARAVFGYTGAVLGQAAANFAAVTDPDAIVLFGGVARAGELLTGAMAAAFRAAALHLYRDRVKILVSELNDAQAPILGASALGWNAQP